MIRTTKITGTFKKDTSPDGYGTLDRGYEFNLIVIGNAITLFPTSDNQVLSFDSLHDFLLAFSEIKN